MRHFSAFLSEGVHKCTHTDNGHDEGGLRHKAMSEEAIPILVLSNCHRDSAFGLQNVIPSQSSYGPLAGKKIAVAGAGIAGLTFAISLRRL